MMKFYKVIVTIILTFLSTIRLNISEPISPIDNNSIKEDNRMKFSKLLNSIASINKERLVAFKKYNDLDKYSMDGMLRTSGDADPLVAVLFLNKSDPSNNVLYEIFDSDLTYEEGDTPVRDVLQEIKNYYNIANNPIKEDSFNTDKNVENTFRQKYQMERMDRGREYSKEKKAVPKKNLEPSQPVFQATRDDDSKTDDDGEEIKNITIQPKNFETRNVKKINYRNKKYNKEDTIVMNDTQVLRIFKSCSKKALKVCKKACKAALKRICDSYKCSSSMRKSFKRHCNSECKSKFDDYY